jgi:hypothetical protein
MRHFKIEEVNDEYTIVTVNGTEYDVLKDSLTGDWSVGYTPDGVPHSNWMLTKEDAINFALEHGGFLNDANYDRAPDRTSA